MATISRNLPHCTHRYALFISYLGSRYNGSQRLINRDTNGIQDTVQEAIEWSLETTFSPAKCRVTSCSRTDKGVHALMNCYSLPLMDFSTPTEAVMKLANSRLASKQHEIMIKDVMLTSSDFHPRREAKSREYIYNIVVINNCKTLELNKAQRPRNLLCLLPVTDLYKVLPVPCLNYEKALAATDLFRGEHDFASFALPQGGGVYEDTVRNLEISLSKIDNSNYSTPDFTFYQFHLKSKSFLYNQVRRLVGAVLSYATYERIELDDIKFLLDNPKITTKQGKTRLEEPWGLYLSRINYDRTAFEGAIRTYMDGRSEKVIDFPPLADESDDGIQKEQNCIASAIYPNRIPMDSKRVANKKTPTQTASQQSTNLSGPSYVQSGTNVTEDTDQKDHEAGKLLDTLCPAVRRMGYTSNPHETIGVGAFSRVYRARSTKIPNKDIAVKIVRVDDTNIPQAWKEYSMKRELKILKRVKHPNVITIYDVIKTRTRIYIFMDLAAASVSSHLEATEEPASEQTARNWFGGISNAIAYLHQIDIAHRDLKNDNILIDSNGNAKLTDFGFACFTVDKKTKLEVLSKTSCGTKAYVAPEVFSPPYNSKVADVWSLGVCLFECVTLMLPFRDDLPPQVYIRRQIEKGLIIPRKLQSKLNDWLQDLLKRMIEPDVNKRIRSEAVLVHPWMRMPRR